MESYHFKYFERFIGAGMIAFLAGVFISALYVNGVWF